MSFIEVSELEWASQLMGAMDFKQEFLKNFTTRRTTLGRGSFAKVFSARSTRDGKRRTSAVKLMESKSDTDDEMRLASWAQEWHIWRTLCPHPNILQLYEVYYGKVETHQKIAMVSELVDRDLRAYIMHYARVDLEDARVWTSDMCTGLGHMHSHHIAHRDMKPANCMLKHQPAALWQLQIRDFGQAAVLHRVEALDGGEGTPHTRSLNESPCTWDYAAPEVVHKKSYDFKLDVWSAGAILWQMLQVPI